MQLLVFKKVLNTELKLKVTKKTIVTLVLWSVMLAQVSAQTASENLSSQLEEIAKQSDLPGFAVALVSKDKVLYQKGFGFANLEDQIAFTEHTLMNIGSITKTLISVALMKLVEEGKLSLDDEINQFRKKRIASLQTKNQICHQMLKQKEILMTTFILIHGSFHAAWNWHKVIPPLEQKGHKTIAMDMPGHGLDTTLLHKVTFRQCVDKVIRQLDAINDPVVLLAHSRNGMIISQVAEERPEKIKKLVYLAAYLIPNGKSMMDYAILDKESLVYQNIHPKVSESGIEKILGLFKKTMTRTLLEWITPKHRRTHSLDKKTFRDALYHDCPDEITELANVLLTPEPNFPGFVPLTLTEEKYGSVSKVYIECLQDRAVTLNLQRRMQEESPCEIIYQLDSSHSPFFSMPDQLVEILLKL